MKIDVYNWELSKITSVLSWVSLVFETKYKTYGKFQLELIFNEDNLKLAQQAKYVTTNESDEVVILMSWRVSQDRIIINGFTADYILSKRVQSRWFGLGEVAADLMVGAVNGINSWHPLLVAENTQNIQDSYRPAFEGGSVLEFCEAIAEKTDIGFKVVKEDDHLKFVPYKPSLNKQVKFAPEYGNVFNQNYTWSLNEFSNVAYVIGGDLWEIVVVEKEDAVPPPIFNNRFEILIDATSINREDGETLDDYKKRLEDYGQQKLAELTTTETTTFEVNDQRAKLGDLVSVRLTIPVERVVSARVVGVVIKSQENKTTRTLTLSAR